MKQVKYFDVYSKGKITKYCVDSTKQYKDMVRILKNSDKDAIVTYIEFDDGTNGITDEWYNSVNIKINDVNINRAQQSNEKSLADFRKLSKLDKYMEWQHYGEIISSTDIVTIDGYLTIRITEIYNTKFVFILLAGNVINCYELQ